MTHVLERRIVLKIARAAITADPLLSSLSLSLWKFQAIIPAAAHTSSAQAHSTMNFIVFTIIAHQPGPKSSQKGKHGVQPVN
jgi:hypothetical protein